MQKTKIILFLAFVVIVSGCTSNGSSPGQSAKKDVPANYVHLLDVKGNNSPFKVAELVENRLNIFGITYVQVDSVKQGNNSSVLVYTPDESVREIREVLKPVNLHASVNLYPSRDSSLRIKSNHSVSFSEESLNVSGTRIAKEDTGTVENVRLTYNGVVQGSHANVTARVFDSSNILQVQEDRMRILPGGGTYRYSFPVVIEEEAGIRMRNLARNFGSPGRGGMLENSLGERAKLDIFFRGKKLSSLTISSAFKEQVIREPTIQGSASSESKARSTGKELVSSIQAGELPGEVKLVSVKPFKPNSTSSK